MLIAVSNLRVNNKPTTSVVKITEPFPTVSWEYEVADRVDIEGSGPGVIDHTYAAKPYSFEIKLGTSSINLGTAIFNGNLADTGVVISNSLQWRYRGSSLSRGQTVYGQLKITDDEENTSAWKFFTIKYNQLPIADSAAISPNSPTTHDDLLLSYAFSDSDGDVESGSRIWWFKNGIHERQFDNKIVIESKYLSYNDQWSAQIFPSDGLETGKPLVTFAVTISTLTPEASNAVILPENPTYNDPLYAKYTFTSPHDKPDNSVIRWYVNGTLQSDKNAAFARIDINEGDTVHYEIQPNDGDVSGQWVSSAAVTIVKPPFVVEDLRANGEIESLTATLTPSLSWRVSGPRTVHTKIQIVVGTAPGAKNVYDSGETDSSQFIFVVPEGILEKGRDYYISVAVGGTGGVDEFSTIHIRTAGSRWHENVSNSTGWTIETTLKVQSTVITATDSSSSSSSSASDVYQGIRIYDGSRYAEVRIYVDRLALTSGSMTEYKDDNTDFATYTIIGHNNTIKVFKNYQLVLDGTSSFTSPTNTKLIEFGAIGSSPDALGTYLNFTYTTTGAYDPSSSNQYFDTQFETFLKTGGSIDFIAGDGTDIYYAVSDEIINESATVYRLSDQMRGETAVPMREGNLVMNSIEVSPDGDFTYFCHENGLTVFRNKVVPQYDASVTSDPVTQGWTITKQAGSSYTVSSGINITTAGGKLFFSQSQKGSPWFDLVDNHKGWTVAFSLRVDTQIDEAGASATDMPDGFGVYVNDGKFQEVIHFFKDQIVLTNAGSFVSFNTTVLTEYVFIGEGRSIKLYYKANNGKYRLLAETDLIKPATSEGNGGRPSIVEDISGDKHAVWHDDGKAVRSIYYSYFGSTVGKWSAPVCITSGSYDCANPDLTIDVNGTIYVVFESLKSDSTDISMVVKNAFGWSKPFLIDSGQFHSIGPKIVSDAASNLYLVWEDHRDVIGAVLFRQRKVLDGRWTNPVSLTDISVDAARPSIAIDETIGRLYATFTQKTISGRTDVFATTKLSSSAAWDVPVQISTNGNNADFADIAADNGVAHVTWHDNKSGSYQIYARRINSSLSTLEAEQKLTSYSWASRFPKNGIRHGSDSKTGNVYVTFESGGDIDYPADADYNIRVAYFDQALGVWLSSNQTHTVGLSTYGGSDVLMLSGDMRQSRRPTIAKSFAGNAHIVYEMEFASDDDEYLAYADKFVSVRGIIWDLTYASTYTIVELDVDLKISGQLERKEIRFGDFSDVYGGTVKFGYFKYLATEAVGPFDATLLLEGSKVNDAVVNINGDGWIAAQNGLNFYFNGESRIAKFPQGLFNQGPITDVAFDNNNLMYVVAAGLIYVSHDHLNFYHKFTYVTNARSIAFDSNNFMWVASASGVYKINVWSETNNIAREGTSIPPAISSSSSSAAAGSSSSSSASTSQAAGNEIKSTFTASLHLYAFVLDPTLKVWNNSTKAFETSTTAHWTDYVIDLTELGLPGTYAANFPTAITTPAIYYIYIYIRTGTTGASTDQLVQQGEIDWDGTKERGYVPPTNNTGSGGTTTPSNPIVFICEENVALGYTTYNIACGMPTNDARKVYVDARNQTWIATANGLVLIVGNRVSIFSSDNSAMPSDDVNDIAIVNSAVRYIATSDGLSRMYGTSFERITFMDADWSEDVTAVAWRSPNTLWMGAGGKIIQLTRDAVTSDYSFISFPASEYANFTIACKNSQRFAFSSLDISYLLQVIVNGRVVDSGYRIGANTLVFDSPLLDSDRVQISVRKDIQKWATLEQNKAEKLVYGDVFRSMKKFAVEGTRIYGIADGDKNQVVVFDGSATHMLPYDSIVLDQTPPTGELEFVQQVDGSIVKLHVANAVDNLSGIKEMRVTNYPNGTTDGSTPASWIPFRDNLEFDLGADFGNIYTQIEFSDTEGRRLCAFKDIVYAGTASPAQLFRFDPTLKLWQYVVTFDPSITDTSIEFMIEYKNALYVGTSAGLGGKLWTSSNGSDWRKVIDYSGRAYAATTLNNLLYIGTDGTDGGQLFTYDSVNSQRIANKVGSAIYALHGVNTSVYIGTGEAGILYRWDTVVNRLILVVHDKDTQITAIGSALINPATADVTNPKPDFYLFAGTGTKGRIVKSVNNAPFNISLTSLPTKVAQLKNDTLNQLHAVVGKNLYKYKNRSWAAVYTNKTNIEDVYFDQNGFAIIYDGGIKRINNEKGKKKIYLGLRDVAGNVSQNESIITEIDINDLVGFVNEKRILELNEYGERVWNYDGDESFYSADRVVVEEAEYFSEIFNGTGDHVIWESIYWDAVVPADTNLRMSVRTADTREDLLTAKWTKTFTQDDFEGGDITNISGQFIQFRVTLSTTVRGKTPKLYRINIRSRTRTAVHFFTTNFVLPSRLKGGILTAQTFAPFAADIVFGINTNDSKDFHDYQIIKTDQLFSVDPTQDGKNLRIGIKLISPLNVKLTTDLLDDEYSPYYGDTYTNVIPFDFTNTTSAAKKYFFKVELFETTDMSVDAFTTIFTGTTPNAFAINGIKATEDGVTIGAGGTVSILVALKGNAAIRCNQYYFARVSAITGTTTTIIDDSHEFVANCSVNYDNTIEFDFTNSSGSSHDYHFRAMFYADPTRTVHIKTYSSTQDIAGWLVGGLPITTNGKTIASADTVPVTFTPPMGDLVEDNYYLVVDYYDGTSFHNITKSPTIAVTTEAEYSCGEYTNVPIVKDIALQIELEEFNEEFGGRDRARRTFNFNVKL